jgi:hypothetical protein
VQLHFNKTVVNSFARKSSIMNYHYTLDNSSVLQTECLNVLGVLIDQKLYILHAIVTYKP